MSGPLLLSRRARLALILGGWCQALWCLAALLLLVGASTAPGTHIDFVTFSAPTGTTTGRLLEVIEHERRDRHGDWSQFGHRFTFDVDGHAVRAASWSRQRAGDVDDEVEVEYLRGDPAVARIAGTTTKQNQPWVILLGLLACFGAFAWTLWRASNVAPRAARVRDLLAAAKPHTAHGFLPKIRLDRDGQLVTWSPATLLLCPAFALAALAFLMVVM